MTSETPRVDEELEGWGQIVPHFMHVEGQPSSTEYVRASFARQLERELKRVSAAVLVALERALNDDAEIGDLQERLRQAEADLVKARDTALEDAAKAFDGFTYGPYEHPSKTIRAMKGKP